MFKLLDFGDQVGVEGRLFRTRTNELTIWAVGADVPRQELPAAAREVARAAGRRDALSAAVPRPDRQPRCAPRLRRAGAHARDDSRLPRRARLPRGRDADDAADRRRCAGAAVRHAPQRARHEAVHAHRAGAVPEAARGGRHGSRVRDQPQLPQRRDLDAAQSGVHDAGVLPGVRGLPVPDAAHRGDVHRGGAEDDRHDRSHLRRTRHLVCGAVSPAVAAARGGRARLGEVAALGRGRHAARRRHRAQRRRRPRPRGARGPGRGQDGDGDLRGALRRRSRFSRRSSTTSRPRSRRCPSRRPTTPTPSSASSSTPAASRLPTPSAS